MIVMVFVAFLTQGVIKELTIRDIQNVTRLTYINIFTEIEKELMEPINTSVIMANNILLLDFMNEETPETEEKMAEYLTAIQSATGYESVFVTPHSTLNYYYPGGTDEKVDLNSEHAYWYSNRIDAKDAYGVVVNTENLDDWALTIYVDANINDRDGNFAGLAGVGKRITHIQSILTSYLENQGVEGYIVDCDGVIKIHQKDEYIKNKNFYDLENIKTEEIDIKESHDKTMEVMKDNQFFIIQHISELDWYLIVRKSNSDLKGALNYYSGQVISILGLGVLIILLITNYTISRYKKQIITLSNIDHLTNIYNRTVFEIALEDAVKNVSNQKFCLALFDLDNLKKINDDLGHDEGDNILKIIAQIAKGVFNKPDFVSRVGGDEFAVLIHKPLDEAELLVKKFHDIINCNKDLQKVRSTISIGITQATKLDSVTTVYKRADEALYQSKNGGKNRLSSLVSNIENYKAIEKAIDSI